MTVSTGTTILVVTPYQKASLPAAHRDQRGTERVHVLHECSGCLLHEKSRASNIVAVCLAPSSVSITCRSAFGR